MHIYLYIFQKDYKTIAHYKYHLLYLFAIQNVFVNVLSVYNDPHQLGPPPKQKR